MSIKYHEVIVKPFIKNSKFMAQGIYNGRDAFV